MIQLKDINKTYNNGAPLHVLKGINLDIQKGEFVSIMGSSGSGKSTLLNILGILDSYDTGEYYLNGTLIKNLSETQAAAARNNMIGYILQYFNLINYKNAVENVALPLYYQGVSRRKRNALALEYLDMLGLREWADHMPNEMSGGQKQRIAIARVFLKNPPILILDEATSVLGNESEILVGQSLEKLAHGRTTLTIAHRLTTIKDYDRILVLGEEGIVEEGAHAQLLEHKGVYYRLWNQLPSGDTL